MIKFGIQLLFFTLFQFLLFSEADAFRRAISRSDVVDLSGLLYSVTIIELIISVLILGVGFLRNVNHKWTGFKFGDKDNTA